MFRSQTSTNARLLQPIFIPFVRLYLYLDTMQYQHSEGRATPSAKLMSSRPKIASKINLAMTRSPPLTTSLNSNVLLDTPHASRGLVPKDSSVKLRIKSTTTPEARSRVLPKSRTGVPPVPPIPNTPSYTPVPSSLRYGSSMLVPSDSEGSLAEGWAGSSNVRTSSITEGYEVEKLEASEAVLVTVR